MEVDPGAASIVASVLLLIGVVVQSRRSATRGQREAEEAQQQEQPAAAPVSFAENIALNEYIDAKIEAATAPLREEIARMTAYVQRTARVLRLLREAFRQFIRDVARDWGKTDHPPQIDPTIRDMLLDDDLDNTFNSDELHTARAEYRSPQKSGEDFG